MLKATSLGIYIVVYQFIHTVPTSIITYFFIYLTLETLFKILNGNKDQELMYMYVKNSFKQYNWHKKIYGQSHTTPFYIYLIVIG